MDNHLEKHYSAFEADHERRKSQLMASLPQQREEVTGSREPVRVFRVRRWTRAALAAAAVLLIAVGVSFMSDDTAPINPQAAWASAVDNAGLVETVHLNATTGSSSLEMWWRRPDDFRMAFSNGTIITHNGQMRCNFNPKTNTLVKSRGGTAGLQMFVLGELGQVFTSNHHLTANTLKHRTLLQTTKVVHKGEKCRKLTFVKDADKNTMLVCIVDAAENFIYDMKMYHKSHPEKILYHIEVLEVDQIIPDSLFVLQSQPGQRVVDRM